MKQFMEKVGGFMKTSKFSKGITIIGAILTGLGAYNEYITKAKKEADDEQLKQRVSALEAKEVSTDGKDI